MDKLIKLMVLCVGALLIIVGCGNDGVDSNDADNIVETPGEEDTNDDGGNTGDEEDADSDDLDSEDDAPEDTAGSSSGLLSLGEKGLMETAIGDYEITVHSFAFIDGPEEHLSGSQKYIAVDLSINNIGNETLISEDVAMATITDSESGGRPNETALDIVEHFEGDIEPGEEVSGQLLFRFREEDTYNLRFGANLLESLTNELVWEFNLDEAN
ncbi:protein of unknown function [Amphibacillus marinus]|uniref:DUF4352 domain-containing protein n=1 Tax=Amphibacillus marinus TaxID=872970 RepID=A0A1H8R3D6_9BACI|nr:DUF4352 domain-containing protein [Amphibacillus marinus]SEO60797.1 protein of unknown function [Amphibacillus marinus]